MRPLSYTKFSIYNRCPLMYKLTYIDRLPQRPRPQYSLGRSIHAALEAFNGHGPKPPTLEDLLGYLDEFWDDEGYADNIEEEEYREQGRKMLALFFEELGTHRQPVFAFEKTFNVLIDGIPLTGRIDLIERSPNGTLEIIDYKSGKDRLTKEDVRQNKQLALYQLALESEPGVKVEHLTIYLLRYGKRITVQSLSEEEKAELVRAITYTAQMIELGSFEPTLNRDCPCDWPKECPYFKDLFRGRGQTTLMQHDRVTGVRDDRIDDLVAEYAKLVKGCPSGEEPPMRVHELESKMRGYCMDRGILRIYSEGITISMVKRTAPSGEWYWTFELGTVADANPTGLEDTLE